MPKQTTEANGRGSDGGRGARREKGQLESEIKIIEWPPGTFMGEQLLEPKLQRMLRLRLRIAP